MQTKRAVLIALLPTLHLAACLIVAFARPASGWMYVSMIDFPASAFAMALSYNWDRPLVLFGAIGTLWWLMLSVGAAHLYDRISKQRSERQPK
jgi:hypothetical protein